MPASLSPAVPVASAPSPAVSSLDRGSFRPHPPEIVDLGRKPGQLASPAGAGVDGGNVSQVAPAPGVMTRMGDDGLLQTGANGADVFDQPRAEPGRQPSDLPATVREGLALIDDARPPRNLGGRPRAIDDVAKIKIATLMATGASLRQVAGFLGVSHSTVSATIAADRALKEEIDAARQRAVLHPLACIVRESGRNWKAAVWLMDYLNKQAARERPPEEQIRDAAEAVAAVGIQNDLAREIREQAKVAHLAQQRREEDEEWRREIAARKARKLARAQREMPARPAAGVPETSLPPAAHSS